RCIRCRKCRMVLAHNNDIQDHEPGNGQTAFAYRKREGLLQQQQIECANIFIEPLSWIEGKENDTSNKIVCPNPKCGAKLGGYNWSGDQCSCGAWIAPAFSIH
ncbi:putative dual specificity protein phosphatase, partial [Gaertneriomyces semiglobifer]